MARYTYIFLIICVLYTARPVYSDSSTGCDDGWLPYNNYCYMINTVKSVSQAAAAQECNNQDASLLRIETQDQLKWLLPTLKSYPSSGYWTDLNDNPKVAAKRLGTGVWKWGSYEYANMSLIIWNKSPANDGKSNCGAINIQGKLADLDCSSKQGYICRYASDSGCPLAWISDGSNCYWIANTSDPSALKSWTQAKSFCEGNGNNAKLFVINNQNDMTFLSGELPYLSQTTKVHWVGLQATSNTWSWYTGGSVDTTIVQWQQEPDNVAGIENCGVMRMTGTFSDRDCSSNANFICYKPQYKYSPTDNIGCGPWIRAGKFCYGFVGGKMKNTWSGARGYCQSMGADLIKVDSFDKKDWLSQQMIDPANSGVFWTGLNDQKNDGTYVWADGTPLNTSYISWNQEPNDYKGFEDCAVIYSTGQYNDITCTFHAPAICELDNTATCPSSPAGWKQNGGNCYLFTPYKDTSKLMNQNEAAAYCATFATSKTNVGALLSVDTQDEKAFILSQVKTMPDNLYGWYTSLNDKVTEGYWAFNSGPLLDQTLVDWTGEPSTNPGDNCGMVNYAGAFHERNCSIRIGYICERYATGYSTGASFKASVAVGFLMLLVSKLASF